MFLQEPSTFLSLFDDHCTFSIRNEHLEGTSYCAQEFITCISSCVTIVRLNPTIALTL